MSRLSISTQPESPLSRCIDRRSCYFFESVRDFTCPPFEAGPLAFLNDAGESFELVNFLPIQLLLSFPYSNVSIRDIALNVSNQLRQSVRPAVRCARIVAETNADYLNFGPAEAGDI